MFDTQPLSRPLLDEGDESEHPGKPKRLSTTKRLEALFGAVASSVPPEQKQLGECLQAATPVLTYVIKGVLLVWPVYAWIYAKAYYIYVNAPKSALRMAFGAALCFFGGTFAASIAAIEAFRLTGGPAFYTSLQVIIAEARSIGAASSKDDAEDADNDGIADVDQIPPHELAKRKFLVGLKAVSDPKRLQTSLGALWTSYLAVLATLRLQFAMTTALALGIVETVELPLCRLLVPPVAAVLGKELSHWVETLVDSGIKLVAILFAWWLQVLISAFYSALRGGRMFADALFDLLVEYDKLSIVEALPGVSKPFDPNTSYLDEVVVYTLAALGFAYQFLVGFSLPFPLNIIFLPLEVLEWFLRWQITFVGSGENQPVG